MEPSELPEAWRAKAREHLGLDVPDDAHGVLQDVHWAAGSFGYFPTYSLGNLIAAEIWNGARAALPDLDSRSPQASWSLFAITSASGCTATARSCCRRRWSSG